MLTYFSLPYLISYIIIFEIKKDIIVLVHTNPDKMAKWYIRPIFFSGFDHPNLVISFRGSKYLPKFVSIRLSNVGFFSNMST